MRALVGTGDAAMRSSATPGSQRRGPRRTSLPGHVDNSGAAAAQQASAGSLRAHPEVRRAPALGTKADVIGIFKDRGAR